MEARLRDDFAEGGLGEVEACCGFEFSVLSKVEDVGCRVQGAGCRVGSKLKGAGCRVQDAGCRVQGAGCRV